MGAALKGIKLSKRVLQSGALKRSPAEGSPRTGGKRASGSGSAFWALVQPIGCWNPRAGGLVQFLHSVLGPSSKQTPTQAPITQSDEADQF